MRYVILIFFVILSHFGFTQAETTVEVVIVDSGKYEFKLQAKSDSPDYVKAFRILSNQVKLDPMNAEYRYFLGYAIDRMNSGDGRDMFRLTREMTVNTSEQFEEVNRLEPHYKGELFLLDPYGKITSVWGGLAKAYLNRSLSDSARWAFEEGKRRGGFTKPMLIFNRQLLNSCDKDAILITYGDNITFPCWYLQTVENFRPDITIIDANLINSIWYPKYLRSGLKLKMSLSDAALDTIEYQEWSPQEVTVRDSSDASRSFSWTLGPSYMNHYLLRGDRILLDIFQQNFFTRPIYFTNGSDSTYNLYLTPYLKDEGLVNRVTTELFNYSSDSFSISRNIYRYNIDNIGEEEIKKSGDAIFLLNGFRWTYFRNVYYLTSQGKYVEAEELIKSMLEKFPKNKLPFSSESAEEYMGNFFQRIYEGYN